MSDVGPILGLCHYCGECHAMVFHNGNGYCADHVPIELKAEDFDLIFEKAGVPGPKRRRPWESVLGILALSKKHHEQAVSEIEQISFGRLLE